MSQRRDRYQLEAPAGVATGKALNVSDLQDKWVQCHGLTGTAALEGKIGSDFDTCVGPLVNGFAAVPQGVLEVRVNRTVGGAGTVWISGLSRSAT